MGHFEWIHTSKERMFPTERMGLLNNCSYTIDAKQKKGREKKDAHNLCSTVYP